MNNSILLKDVMVGQIFYKLNKRGIPQYNGNILYTMLRNSGKGRLDYIRLDKNIIYNESTNSKQLVIIINN